jgi:hypothetical protein
MKRKLITVSTIMAAVFIVNSAFLTEKAASVCDAPLIGAAHTGAPGEVHCATSGCHSGTVNSGPGTTLFEIGGGATSYIPGQSYTVSIDMAQATIDKFGFQVIALKDADNSFVGTYTLTDPTNTRLINGSGGKKYVGSTPCGSDADPVGSLGWTFDWEAPATNEGSITFYLAALATNHNHSTSGDDTYTQTLQLSPFTTGINQVSELESSFEMYPNPAVDQVHVRYALEENADVQITLTDITGKSVATLASGMRTVGHHDLQLDLKSLKQPAGLYSVNVSTPEYSFSKRLSIVQ